MCENQTSKHTGLNQNLEIDIPQIEEVSTVKQVECNIMKVKIESNKSQLCKCDRGQHLNWQVQELGQNEWVGISKNELARLDLAAIEGKCVELVQYMNQQNQHTGFIPLSPLQFKPIRHCKKRVSDIQLCANPVKLHSYVKSFGCPNFIGARVQVNHTMNLDLIDELAEQYWDWQLPLLLRYGFPMDFKGELSDLKSATASHNSALQFPEHVTAYLNDELEHKAIYGPFEDKPFGENTHISPFITRYKPDSSKRRVIIDLSWPENASVNHYTTRANEYLGTAFKLNYPSIDSYTDRLKKLGKGALMHKVDLS